MMVNVREHPLPMTAESVRATIAGTKTQIRQLITAKNSTVDWKTAVPLWPSLDFSCAEPCVDGLLVPLSTGVAVVRPRIQVGENFWIREPFLIRWLDEEDDTPIYKASYQEGEIPREPRWSSPGRSYP